jgi:hypothetical protein
VRSRVKYGIAGAAVLAVGLGSLVSGLGPFAAHAALTAATCSRGQLSLTTGQDGAGGGTSYQQYIITNTSQSACTIPAGNPAVTLALDNGTTVPGAAVQPASGSVPAQAVSLAPSGQASFSISTSACAFDPAAESSTPTSTVIALPGGTGAATFTSPSTAPCDSESVAVSSISPAVQLPPGYVSGPPSSWGISGPPAGNTAASVATVRRAIKSRRTVRFKMPLPYMAGGGAEALRILHAAERREHRKLTG